MKKKLQLKELRGLDRDALEKKVAGYEEELMKLRFRAASGQLTQSSQLRALRLSIARGKTVLKAAELKTN
jgi:large subunit ribosomal protein L29